MVVVAVAVAIVVMLQEETNNKSNTHADADIFNHQIILIHICSEHERELITLHS